MSRKKEKIKFDTVEFRVFVIRNYGTIKAFADKHGLAYQTCKHISSGKLESTNVVNKIKQIMWAETKED